MSDSSVVITLIPATGFSDNAHSGEIGPSVKTCHQQTVLKFLHLSINNVLSYIIILSHKTNLTKTVTEVQLPEELERRSPS